MRVREVMSAPAVVVGCDASVKVAARLLDERGFTALPVVDDGGRLVGVVGEADVLADRLPPDPRLPVPDRPPRAVPRLVGDVVRRDVVTASPRDGAGDLLVVMREGGLRSIPVVEDGVVVGVVTWRDLVHTLARPDADIAADVRRRLALRFGDRWTVRVEDGEVVLASDRAADVPDRSMAIRIAESVIGTTRCTVTTGSGPGPVRETSDDDGGACSVPRPGTDAVAMVGRTEEVR
ncbi:HPP family protein [Pseudonocardia sp. N23]|uniref:CBS domain-containing protein n=1 Tax=Pseudonocardia sp. N23 TaxID=1987376 RepID=UPI000C02D4F8|nr:CBS domain-containing protein [Pseudonocardia sp. N23]GAY07339.1 CBS domain containing protein [Pseudonocardia sp. N23]